MNAAKVNIFQITPRDTNQNKIMLVYADNVGKARMIANAQINPARIVRLGEKSPIMVDVYSEEVGAACEKIEIEYTLVGDDIVTFKYLHKEYCLAKNFAQAIE